MAHFFGTLACTDPRTLADACRAAEPQIPTDPWFGRAGTYRCPLGRRHGSAHFLLRKRDLDALGTAADHALTFEDDAGNRISFARLTLVKAVCVTPGHEDGPLAAFECEAADRRVHLARIPVDKGYNVKTADGGDYQAQTKNAGSAWTWSGVVNDLCTTLGISIPAVPFTPHGTPENLTYYGSFAWAALCDVADRLACAVRYDPVADSFTLVRLGDVAAAADAAVARLKRDGLRTWDAYPVEPERGRRPQKVRVRFRRYPLPTDGSSPWYTVDVTLPTAAGVVAGTYVQFDDDSAALGATGTPSNSATLATRARERADDWARKQRGFDDRFLVEYRDFQPSGVTILGPTVGEVGFDDKGGPMRTVVRAQPDGAVEKFHPLGGLPLPWPPGGDGSVSGATDNTLRDTTTTANTWHTPGLGSSITLPPGDYLVCANLVVSGELSAFAGTTTPAILCRLAAVSGTVTTGGILDGGVAICTTVTGVEHVGTATAVGRVVVTATAVLKFQIYLYAPAGCTWAYAQYRYNLAGPVTNPFQLGAVTP